MKICIFKSLTKFSFIGISEPLKLKLQSDMNGEKSSQERNLKICGNKFF